jgi:outer membrane protein assembly factor BamB
MPAVRCTISARNHAAIEELDVLLHAADLGCTPTVDGGHVYALGQEGDLVCLEAKDGKRVWHRNLLDADSKPLQLHRLAHLVCLRKLNRMSSR